MTNGNNSVRIFYRYFVRYAIIVLIVNKTISLSNSEESSFCFSPRQLHECICALCILSPTYSKGGINIWISQP